MIYVTSELSDTHKKNSQKRNYGQDHWETHGAATRHS
jgi:hypothetical protein